ncbi:MAG: DUF805 domain-containing protein [Candidatus Accumulibacter sp.]|nr:DUF805 domain-containing protein [Accumulibacter sp.]
MRRAFSDAIKNTFNLSGRTSRRGFWSCAAVHFSVLAVLYWIERVTNLRVPGWECWAYIALTGIPFLTLFFRRWHDISSSAWEGVIGIAAILLLYCLRFDLLIAVVLLYFLVRLSQPSVEDNRYGPKPVACLTTFPKTPLSRWSLGLQALQLLIIAACVVGINDPRLAFSIYLLRTSPGLNRMSAINTWVKESLESQRNIEVSTVFAADGQGVVDFSYKRGLDDGETHVLFIPPRVPVENSVCLAYPPGFLKELGIRPASYEGFHRLVAFDSSGITAVRILGSNLFCGKYFLSRQGCLKLGDAILFADTEEDREGKRRLCYRPALKGDSFHF